MICKIKSASSQFVRQKGQKMNIKKIINGKMYNTETATLIYRYCENPYGDLDYLEEELYEKKTGEYFLAGHGGPLTKYVTSRGNNRYGGSSRITPLTIDEARDWLAEHADGQKYIETFGPVGE